MQKVICVKFENVTKKTETQKKNETRNVNKLDKNFNNFIFNKNYLFYCFLLI